MEERKSLQRTVGTFTGKRFVIAFAILLIGLTLLGFVVNARFNAIADQIDLQRQRWPKIARMIEPRLFDLDQQFAASDNLELAKDWKDLRSQYLTSSIYDRQSRLLQQLAAVHRRWDERRKEVVQNLKSALSSDDQKILNEFGAGDQRLTTLMNDPIGKVTLALLSLNYPPRLIDDLPELL